MSNDDLISTLKRIADKINNASQDTARREAMIAFMLGFIHGLPAPTTIPTSTSPNSAVS